MSVTKGQCVVCERGWPAATSDNNGYICLNCGGRVSKWIPIANVIHNSLEKNK